MKMDPSLFADPPESASVLYEESLNGYLYLDPSGRITHANRSLIRWLEDDRSAVIGRKHFIDLVTVGGKIFFETHLWPSLQMHDEVNEIALDLLSTKGTVVPVLLSAILKRDASGTPQFIRMTLFMATERRRYEQEILSARQKLEDLNSHLEQRVSERTQELQTALKDREQLLQEVHHRVKNNLQVILSLLRMQSDGIQNEEVLMALRENQARVHSMALVHQCLYQYETLNHIGFKDYLTKLIQSLKTLYDARTIPSILLDIDDIPMDLETSIPCGLIISEVLTNALRQAVEEKKKGELRIKAHKDSDQGFVISIHDGGMQLLQGVSSVSTGMSYKIVEALRKQIEAHTVLQDNDKGGQTFTLTIPFGNARL